MNARTEGRQDESGSVEILTAIRELSNSKQLGRGELHGLLEDGIKAALAKKHGPNVQAEVEIDDDRVALRISSCSRTSWRRRRGSEPRDRARNWTRRSRMRSFRSAIPWRSRSTSRSSGRAAVQAAKQRILQRVREGERTKIRDEFSGRVGELLSGEIQQIERGKLVVMLNEVPRSRSDDPVPRAESIASISIRGTRSAPSSSASKRRRKGRGSCSAGAIRSSGQGAVPARRSPRYNRGSCEIRMPRWRQLTDEDLRGLLPATTRSIRSAPASGSRARGCRRS